MSEIKVWKNSPNLSSTLDNLGVVYHVQGKYEEAEELHKRALKLFEDAAGPDYHDNVTPLTNLASLYVTTNRPEEEAKVRARIAKLKALHNI